MCALSISGRVSVGVFVCVCVCVCELCMCGRVSVCVHCALVGV